jgi:hypothetical protein
MSRAGPPQLPFESYVSGNSRPAKSGFGVICGLPLKGREAVSAALAASFAMQNNKRKCPK